MHRRNLLGWVAAGAVTACAHAPAPVAARVRRRLYVAQPGIRDYLEYGGHGVLVYDMDDDHRFERRISLVGYGVGESGKPLNVKGICASAVTRRLYVSTLQHLVCLDLERDTVMWQKTFDKGADRMSISPDGQVIYLPSLEQDVWYVVDAATGDERLRLAPNSRAHNTVFGADGARVYLAGLGSNQLSVADARRHVITHTVGPFSHSIRPLTVNRAQSLVFVNVNELLGFEVGDLRGGERIARVEVPGFAPGKPKRHGCPSHGIGLTPDERELWLCDGPNRRLHLFDATSMPPRYDGSIALRDEPGWITFSIDGQYAYPSTGEVIEVARRRIVKGLFDEQGRTMMSEKLLEIDFAGGTPVAAGDQFGIGRAG